MYSKMARLATRVAASTSGAAADAQGRAVGLDVAEALAVIALLRLIHCQHRVLLSTKRIGRTHPPLSWGEGSCCSHGLQPSGQCPAKARVFLISTHPAACSCSTDARCCCTLPRSGPRCRTCSTRDAKGTTYCLLLTLSSATMLSGLGVLLQNRSWRAAIFCATSAVVS